MTLGASIMLMLLGCLALACAPAPAPPPRAAAAVKESPADAAARIGEAIRQEVLARYPDLSSEDRRRIETRQPLAARYFMAGTFGQFGYTWDVSGGREISAWYEGDVADFDVRRVSFTRKAE